MVSTASASGPEPSCLPCERLHLGVPVVTAVCLRVLCTSHSRHTNLDFDNTTRSRSRRLASLLHITIGGQVAELGTKKQGIDSWVQGSRHSPASRVTQTRSRL